MTRPARSKLEADLDAAIKSLWPNEPVKSEVPIKLRASTIYVDRVLEGPKLAFEADGIQHAKYSEHFHREAQGFKNSKFRDALKEEWLRQNGYTLIRFAHNEKITPALIRKKVLNAS